MKLRVPLIAGMLLSILAVAILTCVLPPVPDGPDKAKVELFLKSAGAISDFSITDTVGNYDTIGVILNLTQYIDTTKVVVKDVTTGESVEYITTLKDAEVDTAFFRVVFSTPGDREISATSLINGQWTPKVSVTIHVVDRITGNQKPTLVLPRTKIVIVDETLTLRVTATDPNAGQVVTITAAKKPDNATFIGNILTWTTTIADTGIDTLIFIGLDNGTTAMADTDSVFVTVSATPVNRPPEWYPDVIEYTKRPGTTLLLPLTSICSDLDKDNITFSLLSGTPARDTIIGSTWSFAPVIEDTGKYKVEIIAGDPSGATDTLTINLTISQTAVSVDDKQPTMRVITPSPDSQAISSSSYQIQVACTDESEIASVKWAIGTDTLLFTKMDDTLYAATITGLLPSVWTTIHIVAVDASPAALITTRDVHLKYDSAIPDTIKPVITLLSPATDTVVRVDSCIVKVRCTDQSGVAVVSMIAGIDTVKMVRGAANVFTGTVKHLVGGQYTTITITAVDSAVAPNSKSASLRIKYDNDVTGPVVTLVAPVKDSVTTNSSSYTVILKCTDTSGVKSVNGVVKATSVAGVRDTAATWKISIGSLAANTYTMVIFTVTDSSLRANKTLDTLYIKSEITNGFTITYDKNDSAATGTMASQTISSGAATTLAANTYTKAGSSFAGWATSASGAVAYTDAASYTMGTENVTLYAKWTVTIHTVTFDKNDASATGTMAVQNIAEGAVAPLTANAFTRSGLSFSGWATSATGPVAYADAANYTMGTADVTLYAKWAVTTHTITFDKNDASATGTMAAQTLAEGAVASLTANAFTKTGLAFSGWATSATGAVVYADAANYTMGAANVTLYAKWAANTHTVTFDKNDAAATGTMATQNIAEGAAAPLMANAFAKPGSAFAGWATSASGAVAYTDAASYTMGTANVTLYAKWTANTHTVTFDKNDAAATGTMAAQNIAEGASAALTANAFTKTGAAFAGWATTATGTVAYADAASYTMGTANVTLYAKWTTNSHTVTFDKNDAAATGTMAAQGIAEGAAAPLTANAFIKTGSAFAGWATSATGAMVYTDAASYTMGTANVTLYAKWTANSHNVTFDKNDAAATGTMAAQVITEGAAAPLTANAFTKAGFSFAGWATSTTGAVAYADAASYTMGTANVTLYAKWTAINFAITFDKNDAAATGTMATQQIMSGASAPLTAIGYTKAGFTFAGWATSATGAVVHLNLANYTMGTANVTLFAKWTPNDYTITFNKNDAAATGTMAAQTIASGASAPLTAIGFAKAGWNFDGWATSTTGAVVYEDLASYTMGTANVTLYAKWTAIGYTVTFAKNDAAATGSMANQTIPSGSSAPLTANAFAKAGSAFAGWATTSTGAVAYTNGASYTMGTANVTLYAKWSVINHTVTFDKNDASATGSMSTQTIGEGTSANLSANGFTKAGWDFAGWATAASGAAVYSDQESYTMGTTNVTLYAKWTARSFTVTFNKNDAGASGSTATQSIASGSAAPLNANGFSKPGWNFAGWATSSSGAVAYANQASYTMGTANVTLYAKWTAINYSITFNKNNSDAWGSMPQQYIASGSTVNLNAMSFDASCWDFIGWSTSPTGSAQWGNQALYTMGTSNVTLYAIWAVRPITVTPAFGSPETRVCLTELGTITINAPCAVAWEWYIDLWNTGDFQPLTNSSSITGQGTPTLTCYTQAGSILYCIVTDLAGRTVQSGTYFWGTAFCP